MELVLEYVKENILKQKDEMVENLFEACGYSKEYVVTHPEIFSMDYVWTDEYNILERYWEREELLFCVNTHVDFDNHQIEVEAFYYDEETSKKAVESALLMDTFKKLERDGTYEDYQRQLRNFNADSE